MSMVIGFLAESLGLMSVSLSSTMLIFGGLTLNRNWQHCQWVIACATTIDLLAVEVPVKGKEPVGAQFIV